MSFLDRSIGSFLGLALGDAYGRPLEFVRGPDVRTRPVSVAPGRFVWTDDTHMAIHLAEAVLSVEPGPFDDDVFGAAVGEAFSRWLDDPLTPSTAPGNTCLAGVRAWRRTRDWRTSGVARSDGCGALMRVVPLGIAYAGEALDRAARVSAAITHGHPDAAEAAIAACRLLRSALEEARFDGNLVRLEGRRLSTGSATAAALDAALAQADAAGEDWLDESAVPPGDGGWRSPSALGLAVAAALRWGRDFALAVEKAARIDGDSDSVAALTGMFLGAAAGTSALPPEWVAATRDRARIEALAAALASRGCA